MYSKRGKNYCIDTIWGNHELGNYSRKIVQVILNSHVHVTFIPSYHSDELSFPPPLDWYKQEWKNPENMLDARIDHFRRASIVFYEFGETTENPLRIQSGYLNREDKFTEEETLVFCLDTPDFEKWTNMLRNSRQKIYRRQAKSGIIGPMFPRYEDVSDIAVYRFIHEKLLQWKPLLSPDIIQRLEL